MKHRMNIKPAGVCALLALATVATSNTIAQSTPQYTYTEEWSIVSAPPPAGPFRSVHLDPRIPGQGVAPQAVAGTMNRLTEQTPDTDGTAAAPGSAGDLSQLPPAAAGYPPPNPGMNAPVVPPTAPGGMNTPPVAGSDMPAGILPPPPGPAELSRPPVAGSETMPMEPRGMMPPMPAPSDMPAPPVAGTEPAPMYPRGMMPPMPGPDDMPMDPRGMMPGPGDMPRDPRDMMPPMPGQQQDRPAPPIAGREPAPSERRGMMPPMPGPSDMPAPPVAGTERAPMDPRGMMPLMPGQQRGMPGTTAGYPTDRPDIKPATRPPLTESYGQVAPPVVGEGGRGYSMPPAGEQQAPVSGQYERMWPQYRVPWQYGPGMPGYMNRPQYGYPRAPAWEEQEIPPPSAYPAQPYYGGSTPQ
jgi:hypothetical protein